MADRWRYRDGGGEIGVIASVTQPFCGDCTRARLSADGELYTCLFAVQGHDLRALLRAGASDEELAATIAGVWRARDDRYSELRSAATPTCPRSRCRTSAAEYSSAFVTSVTTSKPGENRTDTIARLAGVTAVGRLLPHGWKDFLFQLWIWLGFGLAYQIARGIADQSPLEAIENGLKVIDAERGVQLLIELDLQRAVLHAGDLALEAVNLTYWLSQFPVLGLALLWIYFFRNDAFVAVRNWIFATNLLGARRLRADADRAAAVVPRARFRRHTRGLVRGEPRRGLVELASNPYAAMPSLHAADALIIGFAMATLVKSRWAAVLWTLWPTWVWFSVMATGNHYWLDIAAGVGVALVGGTIVAWAESGG